MTLPISYTAIENYFVLLTGETKNYAYIASSVFNRSIFDFQVSCAQDRSSASATIWAFVLGY